MSETQIKSPAARPGENHGRDRAILERLSAGLTVRAVAAEFGITHQQISQIKQRLAGARSSAAYLPGSLDRTERLQRLQREGLMALPPPQSHESWVCPRAQLEASSFAYGRLGSQRKRSLVERQRVP